MGTILEEGKITSDTITNASTNDLLFLLPLILHPPVETELLTAVSNRAQTCRVIKLRILLLLNHAPYDSVSFPRVYSGTSDSSSAKPSIRVDMLDLQSMSFWNKTPFLPQLPSHAGVELVQHVFPSKPSLGTWAMLDTSGLHPQLSLHNLRSPDDPLEPSNLLLLNPSVVVHPGNGMVDVVGRLLLRLCTACWVSQERRFGDVCAAPYVDEGEVVLSSEGVLRKSEERWKDMDQFNWEYWRYTKGLSPIVADGVVRSAAGALVGMWAFGIVGERGVVGGERVMMGHINGVFKRERGRGISKEMREGLKEVGVWDAFVELSVKAWWGLRERWDELLAVVEKMVRGGDWQWEKVRDVVGGKSGFQTEGHRSNSNSRHEVDAQFRKWLHGNA